MLDPDSPLPSSPLEEWELMAIAAMMVRRADGDRYIVERLVLLALVNDEAGVAMWEAVAHRVQAIRVAAVP